MITGCGGCSLLTQPSAQRKPFQPPTAPLRITSTIDLSNPSSPHHVKRVLVAPVSALPLEGSDAVHRLKLLAGPRWTPGKPGQSEGSAEQGEGKDGWVKIAEERFPDGRMNRKSVSDMLQRLVQAANVSNVCDMTVRSDLWPGSVRRARRTRLVSQWLYVSLRISGLGSDGDSPARRSMACRIVLIHLSGRGFSLTRISASRPPTHSRPSTEETPTFRLASRRGAKGSR
jgi:hypothetical protein